jgi:glycosyltransferase involved in cell wall biosynthesis
MTPRTELTILQVNACDVGGGAYRIGQDLHRSYLAAGHDAWLAVGSKRGDDPRALPIPNDASRNAWARGWDRAERVLSRPRGRPLVWLRPGRWPRWIGQPVRSVQAARGWEDFDFPGTRRLLELPPRRPDVVHGHNLHGGYFDLRALPWLSSTAPTFLTLHDAWMLSGHCAHSMDCTRWTNGCGRCPDLTLYPRLPRDNTASNWQRKRDLYRRSSLYVATPSAWLMGKVERSMLADGIVEARVVPNGVDLDRFRPRERAEARHRLEVPHDAHVVLFSANGIRGNPWKDWPTMRAAVERVADELAGRRLVFVGLGERGEPEQAGRAELRFVPFLDDLDEVAAYYAAADVYLHAARAETFPNTILEALSCGIPVVATAVGGIPEQVRDLRAAGSDEATGFLAGVGDVAEVAEGLRRLLLDDELRRRLGENAATDARSRFSLERQCRDYVDWYTEILGRAERPLPPVAVVEP